MKLNTDRVVSVSAMVVGIASLIIIVYQTQLTREAQHASVLPYLYFALTANDQGVHVIVTNSGIGPALIDDVRVRYQGKEVVGDPYDFYTSQGLDTGKIPISVDKIMPGRLIPAGASVQMLGAESADGPAMLSQMLHLFEIAEVPRNWYKNVDATGTGKAVIEITFSSVYGDRWRVRSDRIVPERL